MFVARTTVTNLFAVGFVAIAAFIIAPATSWALRDEEAQNIEAKKTDGAVDDHPRRHRILFRNKDRSLQSLPGGCESFITSGFDLESPDALSYFADDSSVTLAQTGTWIGPDDMVEYIAFASDTSPFLDTDTTLLTETEFVTYGPDTTSFFGGSSDESYCQFRSVLLIRTDLSELYDEDGGIGVERTVLVKFFWKPETNIVARIHVHYQDDFLYFFFGQLDTPNTAALLCSAMLSDGCSETASFNNNPTLEECIGQMLHLPLFTGAGPYVDGKSRGCRMLHGIFTFANPAHCPHISFAPMMDRKGEIRCQESRGTFPQELFTPADFNFFQKTMTSFGFLPGTSVHLVSSPTTETTCPRGYYLKGVNDYKCKSLCDELGLVLDESPDVPTCIEKEKARFVLWNADTEAPIGPIPSVIDLCKDYRHVGLTLEFVPPSHIELAKIKFELVMDGSVVAKNTESVAPYMLSDDKEGPKYTMEAEPQMTVAGMYVPRVKMIPTSGKREWVVGRAFEIKACRG